MSAPSSFVDIRHGERDYRIEYRWVHGERANAPVIVFLHEGLGSVSMWKDWPSEVCSALGMRGLVFSRYGYGKSTPRPDAERWTPEFLFEQARDALPAVLRGVGIDAKRDRPVILGHSDGASIALIYAALYPDSLSSLIVLAPHVTVEDVAIQSIAAAREAYLNTDLPRRLARYHASPDSAFWGWNDVWLSPAFRAWSIESLLPRITCPVLAVQGVDDEYGTLDQVRIIRRRTPQTLLAILDDCRHSPHKDQPVELAKQLKGFLQAQLQHT
ncbi:alpha/beta hydrolase [Pigmentiphaga litoralis]|uniref:alpha/beta fold hydrolase n=1 Tax=Pigmentiphaga litoralis TaxID=516702 RepID=UPI00167B1B42|nr:alpha/beta hydrolase [Pigmentiphaga litoralis]GGX28342.1 alpha/beta hydrolase [Pigmentiphaga litoralis]